MESQFICPCCGYRAEFTTEFCETVKSVVKNFIESKPGPHKITYINCGKHRSIMRIDNISVVWSIYFIRKMTGEPFKTVASAIPIAQQTAVKYKNILETNFFISEELRQMETKLSSLIVKKLKTQNRQYTTA